MHKYKPKCNEGNEQRAMRTCNGQLIHVVVGLPYRLGDHVIYQLNWDAFESVRENS